MNYEFEKFLANSEININDMAEKKQTRTKNSIRWFYILFSTQIYKLVNSDCIQRTTANFDWGKSFS